MDPYFFGYGSLVNQRTHAYQPAAIARVTGFRRAWRAAPGRSLVYLTAVRDAGCAIDGLIAPVPGGDWAALDEREEAYDRLNATEVTQHETSAGSVAIYAIAPARQVTPTAEQYIPLSYLDVVVQGYLKEFGADGPAHFFATTDGWGATVLDDRAAPRYPRAQKLTADELALVDRNLQAVDARIVSA